MLSTYMAFLVAVRNVGMYLHFVRLTLLRCINKAFMSFIPAPVSRKQEAVCIALIFKSNEIRHLYVGMATEAMSDFYEWSGNGFNTRKI